MNADVEYGVALEYLQKGREGEIVLAELSNVAKKIDAFLRSSDVLGNMGQMAFSLISEAVSSEILKKNLVLFAYRLCVLAKRFDSCTIFERIGIVFEIVNILQEEQSSWLEEYEKKLQPIHDKHERRKRRKNLFVALSEEHKHVNEDCIRFLNDFLRYFTPQGAESLILPDFAKMFVPKNYLQDNVQKLALFCDKVVSSRTWKETALFYVMTFLFREEPHAAEQKGQKKPYVEFPQELLEKAVKPCTYVLNLFGKLEPSIRFLPKDEISKKVLDVLYNFFETFSLEQFLLSVGPFLSIRGQFITTQKLEDFIDVTSGSPKVISYLLKKLVKYKQSESKACGEISFKDLIMVGIEGAMVDSVIKEKADEFVYQETILKVMQYTHRFIVSPMFDRFLYKIGTSLNTYGRSEKTALLP